jgi:hypothetical protein
MKRRITILSVLVLSFYLFHALFPLLYSIESAQAEEQSGTLPGSSITASQPFVVDQCLLSATSSKEGEDSSSAPASRVLLKKKRAVPASCKNIIEKLSLRYAKYLELARSSGLVTISARVSEDCPICPHGYQRYHSGISPPSA